MKPTQIGALILVAAVGGGLFMKWLDGRQAGPAPAAVVAARPSAVPQSPPAQAEPVPPLPSPFPEKTQITDNKPRKMVRVAQRAAPKPEVRPAAEAESVAQDETPAVQPPAPAEAAKPEPAAPVRATQTPTVPATQVESPAPAPPAPRQVTLAAGTLIPARTVEALSSDRNQAGDTFTATLDQPLVVDGLVIAERGAHLEGKVVRAERAGRVKGLSDLAIELTQVNLSDGQRVAIETETFAKRGETSKREDAAKVGAGAAIGAAIGAIAGGGKGAGIGAAVGGAAGAGDVLATRGKAAELRPETRINFRLKNSVTITERRG
jgi:hypothetical protein